MRSGRSLHSVTADCMTVGVKPSQSDQNRYVIGAGMCMQCAFAVASR